MSRELMIEAIERMMDNSTDDTIRLVYYFLLHS